MQVICIDASPGRISKRIPQFKEGEVLSVQQGRIHTDAFIVLEYPLNELGEVQTWEKNRFIPLSSISETEFVRNYNTEKV